MNTPPTVPAPRTRSRRLVILGLGIAILVAGVVVIVRPIFPALVYPSRQLISWNLGDVVGGPRIDRAKAQTMTVVDVSAWWPGASNTATSR